MAQHRVEVRVPKWGLTTTEVVVTEWVKGVGDAVAAGEPLCSVEAEKVETQLESSCDGVLSEIAVAENGTARVGDVVAVITRSD